MHVSSVVVARQKQCWELAGRSEEPCDWTVDWRIVVHEVGREILEEPVEELCGQKKKKENEQPNQRCKCFRMKFIFDVVLECPKVCAGCGTSLQCRTLTKQ